MAHQVKLLLSKTDSLSSIPRTHIIFGGHQLHEFVLRPLQPHNGTRAHIQTVIIMMIMTKTVQIGHGGELLQSQFGK